MAPRPDPTGRPPTGRSDPNFGVPGVPIFPLPFGIQTAVSVNPFGGPNNTAGGMPIPLTPINPFLPNGITVFPGGFPLYRNGVLIGAVGVSGDGVDQDDIISASATVGFEAPTTIRSDRICLPGRAPALREIPAELVALGRLARITPCQRDPPPCAGSGGPSFASSARSSWR